MIDLNARSTLPERMDQPEANQVEIETALRELETINTWLGGYSPVLNGLKKFNSTGDLTILDIGSGGGDVLRRIARSKPGYSLRGLDKNPLMTAFAENKSRGYKNIGFITGNAFSLNELDFKPDVIISTLFCHHFDDDDLISLLNEMKINCRKGFIINDLHRHWFAYYSIKYITRFFSRSVLVKYDAPLSVARSLTRSEWDKLLRAAGITGCSIRWFWAWRWQIIYRKN